MFDDPNKQLKWMEAELLAAEMPEEPEYEDVSGEEDDDLMQRVDALINETPPQRYNPATDFSRMVYADEEPVENRSKKTRAGKAAAAAAEIPQKNTKIKGLVFLALLETAGILAIIGWWIQWLT